MILLWIWLVCINVVAFIVYGIDKRNAGKRWRVPEKTLFLLAFLGGGIGCLAGMYLLRHKTKHWYFVLGIPLITVLEAILLIFALIKIGM